MSFDHEDEWMNWRHPRQLALEKEAAAKLQECDCCGKMKPDVSRVWAFGIETFACDECRDA